MKLIWDSQFRLADADSLYSVTQLLLSGHFPHFFISRDDMTTVGVLIGYTVNRAHRQGGSPPVDVHRHG